MKKYLILMIMSLISLNVCAGSKVQELVNRLTHTLEFGYDDRSQEFYDRRIAHGIYDGDDIQEMLKLVNYTTQDMLKSIIDDYTKQVKNPYAKHMIKVWDQKLNMTLLDVVLLDEAHIKYYERGCGPSNHEERKAVKSRLKYLIALLKNRGFKQTIPNNKLECVVVILEGDCPDCVACDLKHMGLK